MNCTGMPQPPPPPPPPSSNTAIAGPVATILLSTGGGLIALVAAVGAFVAWKTGALCFAPKGTPQAAEVVAWGEGASPNPLRVTSLNTV